MNIFNPSCPGYARGSRTTSSTTGGLNGVHLYPTGLDFLPGPLVRDTTYWNRIQRDNENKNEPFPSHFTHLPNDLTPIAIGKHFSNSIFYNKENSALRNGIFEAPYWRYNTIYTQLPKYLLLDATACSVVPSGTNVALVMKRNDGDKYPVDISSSYEFLARYYGEILGVSSYRFACATWIPCYDLTNHVSLEPAPIVDSSSIDPQTPPYAPFVITCRPWWQNPIVGPGINSPGIISSMDWHVTFDHIEYPDSDGVFDLLYVFTPVSGYHWNTGAKKRADQWYTSIASSQGIQLDNPEGPTSTDGLPEVPQIVGDNEEFNSRFSTHHGTLDIRGTTWFTHTMTRTNQDLNNPLDSYAEIPTGEISVTPMFP